MNKVNRRNSQGFTLLEVLIAIAIFSVISLTGFTIFDTVFKGDEKSRAKTNRLNELQRAFLIIERDITQITRRKIRMNGEGSADTFIHSEFEGFTTSEEALGFVRQGWSNPGLAIPRSDLQLVGYHLNDTTFERVHFNFVDPVLGEEPKIRPLIQSVDKLSFEFFDGKEWREDIENNNFPVAIAVEIETPDLGLIRRQFLTAGDDKQGATNG